MRLMVRGISFLRLVLRAIFASNFVIDNLWTSIASVFLRGLYHISVGFTQ